MKDLTLIEMEVLIVTNFIADRFSPNSRIFDEQLEEICNWILSSDISSLSDQVEIDLFKEAKMHSSIILEHLQEQS